MIEESTPEDGRHARRRSNTRAITDAATSFEIWDRFVTVHRLDADLADDIMRASCAVTLGIDPTGMHLERIGY